MTLKHFFTEFNDSISYDKVLKAELADISSG